MEDSFDSEKRIQIQSPARAGNHQSVLRCQMALPGLQSSAEGVALALAGTPAPLTARDLPAGRGYLTAARIRLLR